ncbi:MAG TPA: ribonuclease D, partial [Enterovirga sp.]|nr:ribonuclease D [Enterovirga sp.]
AADILAAVETGLARDPTNVPVPARSRQRAGGAVVELLKVLLKAVAEEERVAPKVIATVEDLEAIAERNDADVAALSGWRRTLFGEKALDLKAGRIGLSVNGGRIVVQASQEPPAA